jgi:hypothetical protein
MSSAQNALAPNIYGVHIPGLLHTPRRALSVDAKPPVKTDARAELRTAQRRYIALVLKRDPQQRTLSQIAKAGGLNHTTLTRFYNNPVEDRLLESMTIQIIARTTGVTPPPELMAGAAGLAEETAEPYEAPAGDPYSRAIQALLRGRNTADPLVLRTRALEDAGFFPGDIVILDQAAAPAGGDVVCANVYDRNKLAAETVWRIFQPPYLIAASRDPAYRKPLYVDGEHVLIRGVVTDQLRRRASAA